MAPSCPSTPSTEGAPRPAGSGPRLPVPPTSSETSRSSPAPSSSIAGDLDPVQGAVMDAAPRIPPPAPRRRSSDPRNGCSAARSAPTPRSRPFPMPALSAPSSIASPGSRQVLCPVSCLCARGRQRASLVLAPAAWATRTAKAQRSSSPLAAARNAKSFESVQSGRIRSTTLTRLFHGFILLPSGISVAGTSNAML